MRFALAVAALGGCWGFATLASGASGASSTLPESLLACAKLQDANERVRCYDAQIAAVSRSQPHPAPAPAALPAAPAGAAAAMPAQAAARASGANAPAVSSGLPRPLGAPSPPGQPRSAGEEPSAAHFGEELLPQSLRPSPKRNAQVLDSSITEVRKVGYDSFLISLANGQIWREDGNHITFFRAGEPVRIERRSLGSYHLSSPVLGSKNWVYVTRVR